MSYSWLARKFQPTLASPNLGADLSGLVLDGDHDLALCANINGESLLGVLS